MRLLRTGPYRPGEEKLEIVEFPGEELPPYAILSHTWGADEVLFADIEKGSAQSREGFEKIKYLFHQALEDGCEYAWIDTCCIDKTSSAELSEAINR